MTRVLAMFALMIGLTSVEPAVAQPVPVTADNFVRAETDMYFRAASSSRAASASSSTAASCRRSTTRPSSAATATRSIRRRCSISMPGR